MRRNRWLRRIARACKRLAVAGVVAATGTTVAVGTIPRLRLDPSPPFGDHRVERVVDGDTIVLTNGLRVRLAQIDAPEYADAECFADAAKRTLEEILPEGTYVAITRDRALDNGDRFGRAIRYVLSSRGIVNLELVRRGAASVWFVNGDRGRHARKLLRAARSARRSRVGLWRDCPGTALDTSHGVQTGARRD